MRDRTSEGGDDEIGDIAVVEMLERGLKVEV